MNHAEWFAPSVLMVKFIYSERPRDSSVCNEWRELAKKEIVIFYAQGIQHGTAVVGKNNKRNGFLQRQVHVTVFK